MPSALRDLATTRLESPRLQTKAYRGFCARMKEINDLRGLRYTLGMHQRFSMPAGAIESRAREQGLISAHLHTRTNDAALLDLARTAVEQNKNKKDPIAARNLALFLREQKRVARLPAELAAQITEATSLCHGARQAARAKKDFSVVAPAFEKVVRLRRQESAAIDGKKDPYDVQLQTYAPGITGETLAKGFRSLRDGLAALLEDLQSLQRGFDPSLVEIDIPAAAQHRFFMPLVERMGFDFTRGRIDYGEDLHPCCSENRRDDVWILLRYPQRNFFKSLRVVMHEAGHGMYEQGVPNHYEGQPVGQFASFALHESQSIFWERCVGLSPEFFSFVVPHLQSAFGKPFLAHGAPMFYRGVHTVRPGLNRVEADEVTYPLHIILRFELERALLRGELEVSELEAAWNEKTKTLFGLDVPNADTGILQDVQWFAGYFGYFPTYALGSIYAYQLFQTAENAIPHLRAQIARGEFRPLKTWLTQTIHEQGNFLEVPDLMKHVTGKRLDTTHFLATLRDKYTAAHH